MFSCYIQSRLFKSCGGGRQPSKECKMIRILHVEDMPEDAELLQLKLRKFNNDIELSWTSSAREALSRMQNNSFDCILSDYQMPGMDGLQLLKTIRGEGTDLPFIFFTGQGNEHLAEEAFNNGADDYYTKEAGFAHYDRLVNSIRKIVDGHRATQLRARSERALRAILNGTATETSTAFFQSLVLNLARAAGVRYATIGRKFGDEIKTLAFSADGEIANNFNYHYRYAPCNETLNRGLFFVPDSVQSRFPSETSLVEMGLESYCGCSLASSDGEPLGVLTLLHDKPLQDKQFILSMMRIFASRATAEVEREIALESLRQSEWQYRSVFNALDDAVSLHDPITMAILDVNEALTRLIGHSYQDTLVKNTALKHPSYSEKAEAGIRKAFDRLSDNTKTRLNWTLITKTGERIKTELVLKKISSNQQWRVLAIFRPIE